MPYSPQVEGIEGEMSIAVTVTATPFAHLELRLGEPNPNGPMKRSGAERPANRLYEEPSHTLCVPVAPEDEPVVRYVIPSATV